jgi:hypothetical protein
MRHRTFRRRALRTGTALTLVLGTPFVLGGTASASGTFEALASAYGADYLMSNPSIPAGVSPQFGGPVAQSQLTSLPSGTSFASMPYPGEVAAGVPGLVSGVATGVPQLPAYPFIVSSGLGEGAQNVNQPGIALHAATENDNAAAHAVFGTDGQGSVADSLITADGDNLVAAATSRDSALSLGDAGEIGSVLSSATVSSDGSKITRQTSLQISGIRIPALAFTVPATSPGPAPIPNTPFPQVPLPFAGTSFVAPVLGFYDGQFTMQIPAVGKQQFAVPFDAVAAAFKQAGYELQYSAPTTTPDGIIGATLRLHFQMPAPPDNPIYAGPTDYTIVLGRATASIDGSGGSGTATSPGGAGGVAAGTTTQPALGGVTGRSTPGTALPSGQDYAAGVPAPVSAQSAPGAVAPPTEPVRQMTIGSAGFSSALGFHDATPLKSIYLVLAAAGVLAVFSVPTLRLRGAR